MEKQYDVMVVGPVSLDQNIDYEGHERREVGGAVVASGFAAAGSGVKTAIFCKFRQEDVNLEERLSLLGCLRGDLLHKKPVFYCRQGETAVHLPGCLRSFPL